MYSISYIVEHMINFRLNRNQQYWLNERGSSAIAILSLINRICVILLINLVKN